MSRYFRVRLFQAIPTLFLITVVGFALLHSIPGGPAEVMLGDRATPALIAQVNRSLGLNKPLWQQYLIWVGNLLRGNFGYAYSYHQSVLSLIALNLPRTLIIVGVAIMISHILAIALGLFQALRRDTWYDHVLTLLTYFLYSMPVFWLALVMVDLFAIRLGWFPTGGIANPYRVHPGFWSYVRHTILPIATLVVVTVAGWTRYMRSAVIDTLAQDYIRTARAKGLSDLQMLVKHALKNSVLPLITLAGLSLPTMFGGALLIEMVFNYPGMGLLFWTAAQSRDYPVLLGILVLIGCLTILGNLLADLCYALVDPRVRYQ